MLLFPRAHRHAKLAVLVMFAVFAWPAASFGDEESDPPNAKDRDTAILQCMTNGISSKKCENLTSYEFNPEFDPESSEWSKWEFRTGDSALFEWPTLRGPSAAEIFLDLLQQETPPA